MTQTAPSVPTQPASSRLAAPLFTLTLFLSAALLFFVQPMYARMVLPLLGGSPAVWTTAMLFFQTCLIAGYVYAHLLSRLAGARVQIAVHLLVWAAGLAFLPIALPGGHGYDPGGSAPVQTLALFALGVGIPFTALAANAPLIQRWYAFSNGPSADDPYFLYAASNAGSLIALLAFPLAAEPLFGAASISVGWAIFYLALGAGLLACGLMSKATAAHAAPSTEAGPGLRRMAIWIGLAFIPSSLMLAVTSLITADIGSFPLIWVIPLALYLLTFVITFESRIPLPEPVITTLFVLSLIASGLIVALRGATEQGWLTFVALIAGFFFIALYTHKRLYMARPGTASLTIFYVCMSVGGALGGLFNSILAPVLFNDVYEAAFTLALAALLLRGARVPVRDIAIGLFIPWLLFGPNLIRATLKLEVSDTGTLLYAAAPTALALWLVRRYPLRFFTSIAVIFVLGHLTFNAGALYRERSFFGVNKVWDDQAGLLRTLSNGTTQHGMQRIAELGGRPVPLSYYYPGGPMGRLMASALVPDNANVGIVGLGAGALACYRRGTQNWQFYEVDAVVDRIARDPALFSYMSACAGDAPTYLGDARVLLAQQSGRKFDVLVIDAYSSDAIPVHLLTREAISLYLSRLSPDGLLVLHISNRYFDLAPVIGRAAADLGLHASLNRHRPSEPGPGETGSDVVVLSRTDPGLARADGWRALPGDGGRVWIDDYSNLLGALQ